MPEGTNVVHGADRHLRELSKKNARAVDTLYHLYCIMRFVVNCKARRHNARLESPFSFILQPA